MGAVMNIKLLFIPLLLFSSQLYAETIHLGILNTSGNEAENVLYAETASVLKDKLKPRNVEVSTYDLPGVEKAIAAGKLDFFISNPGFNDMEPLCSQRDRGSKMKVTKFSLKVIPCQLEGYSQKRSIQISNMKPSV